MRSRRTVLLVDENRTRRERSAGLLRSMNLTPIVAYGAREAMTLGCVFRPDVVLCDVDLGDAGAYHLINVLRHDPRSREAGFILLSSTGTLHRAGDFGADVVLPHRYRLGELQAAIESVTATSA